MYLYHIHGQDHA
ncbi:Protein of unknown function [Lactobacillus delbrueckii subsp. bulgaricus]|nr:Protein of unknown function [Lactobacillus delbrueckii subsp. bulgaricus]